MQGIEQATRDGCDVALVDTAGRQQNDIPLMRSIAKLVRINKPDLIVLAGEALVGCDLESQVREFNRCLADSADVDTATEHARCIDAYLLTKFDTVDQKVGAAVTMLHTTQKPILFVGTGQTYTDLHRLGAAELANILLS
jgi:signal recognition particle receptor subunit alpha